MMSTTDKEKVHTNAVCDERTRRAIGRCESGTKIKAD